MSSNVMEQVVVGSILGDGSIGKYGSYKESHCLKQKDYLFWKKKVFDKLIFDKQTARITMKYYEKDNSFGLYVPRHSIFEEYRKLSYPDGKKIVSNKFIKRIGKLAIVVWYFDDGSYNPLINRVQLCSYGFSLDENKKLQKMLKDRFGLNFNIYHRKQGDQYFLVCNGEYADNFLSFINKNALFIPKSLTYKIGKFDKRNKKWIDKKMKYRRDRRKAYYQENKKRSKKVMSDYYYNNKEKFIEYRKKHWEEIKERNRKWREKNKEHIQKYNREYKSKHKK